MIHARIENTFRYRIICFYDDFRQLFFPRISRLCDNLLKIPFRDFRNYILCRIFNADRRNTYFNLNIFNIIRKTDICLHTLSFQRFSGNLSRVI